MHTQKHTRAQWNKRFKQEYLATALSSNGSFFNKVLHKEWWFQNKLILQLAGYAIR